jgi:glyoxalase family protein
VYHFYFGDELGTPGTILTFFPFPNAIAGKRGAGEATIVSFAIPAGSLDFWIGWLSRNGIEFDGPEQKFGHERIAFNDPDGMRVELVEDDVEHLIGWETADIPRQHSVRRFFGTTVRLRSAENTEELIQDVLGLRYAGESGNLKRYLSGDGNKAARFDIVIDPNAGQAVQSAGSVHHIAWRTGSDTAQLGWIDRLRKAGYHPTEVIDRNYFHSIYFRTPGGVLFEIATDQPGFMIDEDRDSLGEALKLPPRYESRRSEIENTLIPIRHTNKPAVIGQY